MARTRKLAYVRIGMLFLFGLVGCLSVDNGAAVAVEEVEPHPARGMA